MPRTADLADWVDQVASGGARHLLLESVDDMIYATNADKSLIFGNWAKDAGFGWYYSKAIRWDTRYRKFQHVK